LILSFHPLRTVKSSSSASGRRRPKMRPTADWLISIEVAVKLLLILMGVLYYFGRHRRSSRNRAVAGGVCDVGCAAVDRITDEGPTAWSAATDDERVDYGACDRAAGGVSRNCCGIFSAHAWPGDRRGCWCNCLCELNVLALAPCRLSAWSWVRCCKPIGQLFAESS
jgi:hypothetical protein